MSHSNINNNHPRRPVLPPVQNPKIEAQIETYKKTQTVSDLDLLLDQLKTAVILLLAAPGPDKKPAPVILNGSDEKQYLAVFTSKEHLDKSPQVKTAVAAPFMTALNTVKQSKSKLNGVVVNPFSQNIRLDSVLLSMMEQGVKVADRQKAAAEPTIKKVQLTDEQINQLERMQFETQFLAKKFYEGGKAFTDELVSRKEELVDELFEESYKNKRMYPYLTEEFNVFSVSPDDTAAIIRISMPERDLKTGCAHRIYMIVAEEELHYYMIIEGKQNEPQICRVGKDLKPEVVGPAPDAGQEIYTILNLIDPEETI